MASVDSKNSSLEQTTASTGKLSPLQLHMLRAFDRELTEEQEKEIKQLIADYFFRLVDEETGEIEIQKKYTSDDFEKMAHEHRRTPYQQTGR